MKRTATLWAGLAVLAVMALATLPSNAQEIGSARMGRQIMRLMRQQETGQTQLEPRRQQSPGAPKRRFQEAEQPAQPIETAPAQQPVAPAPRPARPDQGIIPEPGRMTPPTPRPQPQPRPQPEPEPQQTPQPFTQPPTADAAVQGDPILQLLPADTLFALRLNRFDFSVGQLDQYLAGVIPIPVGLSMLARGQMAAITGDPMLNNIDTRADAALFMAMANDPQTGQMIPQVAMLLPVTDYQQFISGNPNISADAQGLATLNAPQSPLGPLVLAPTASPRYALVSSPAAGANLNALRRQVQADSLARALPPTLADQAQQAPVWLYLDADRLTQTFGPLAQQMVMQQMPQGQPGAPDPMGAAQQMEQFQQLAAQLDYLTLTLEPSPNMLVLNIDMQALGGTELEKTLTNAVFSQSLPADAPQELRQFAALMKQVQAQSAQMGDTPAMQALRNPEQAGVAVSFNLVQLLAMAAGVAAETQPDAQMAAMMLQGVATQIQGVMAMAVTFDQGRGNIQIALPKDHLMSIAQILTQMAQQTMQGGMQMEMGDMEDGGGMEMTFDMNTPGESDDSVQVVVRGGLTDAQQDRIAEQLESMIEGPNSSFGWMGIGDEITFTLSPIEDPQSIARQIRFGTVTEVRDRTIVVDVK